LHYRPAFREQLFTTVRRVADERFGEGVRQGLALNLRLRARFLQEDDVDRLHRLAEIECRVGARVQLNALTADGSDVLIGVSGHLIDRETGEPLLFRRAGDRVLWDLPAELVTGLTDEDLDWTPTLTDARLDVSLRNRADTADFLLPVGPTALSPVDSGDGRAWLLLQSEARLSVDSGAAGSPLNRGLWDVRARVTCTGNSASVRLGDQRGPDPVTVPEPVTTDSSRLLQLYWTVNGNLSIAVDRKPPGKSLEAHRTGPIAEASPGASTAGPQPMIERVRRQASRVLASAARRIAP
jgi:hypothetical protein